MAFRGASRLWPGGRGLGGSGRAGLWSQGPRQSSLRVPAPWNQAASPACTAGGTSGHGASAQSSPFSSPSSPSPLPGALTAPSPPARATSYCFVSRGRNPTRGQSPINSQIHGRMGPELWERTSDERKGLGRPPALLLAPFGAERLVHTSRPKSAQASVSPATTAAQMGRWSLMTWGGLNACLWGRTEERGWRRTKVPLFHATATPGVK